MSDSSRHSHADTTGNTAKRLKDLNDDFRRTHKGGIVSISLGMHLLGRAEVEKILKALGGPQGDAGLGADSYHEYGEMTLGNRTFYWDISYWDKAFETPAPNPTDTSRTLRYLAIYMASELEAVS